MSTKETINDLTKNLPSAEELLEYAEKHISKEEYISWTKTYAKATLPKIPESEFICKCIALHYLDSQIRKKRAEKNQSKQQDDQSL